MKHVFQTRGEGLTRNRVKNTHMAPLECTHQWSLHSCHIATVSSLNITQRPSKTLSHRSSMSRVCWVMSAQWHVFVAGLTDASFELWRSCNVINRSTASNIAQCLWQVRKLLSDVTSLFVYHYVGNGQCLATVFVKWLLITSLIALLVVRLKFMYFKRDA